MSVSSVGSGTTPIAGDAGEGSDADDGETGPDATAVEEASVAPTCTGQGGNSSLPGNCQQSVAAFCSGYSGCDLTWAAAKARFASSCQYGPISLTTGCYGCNVFWAANVDAPTFEYFDMNTGNLVAIVGNQGKVGGGETCFAGPPTFALPDEQCPASATTQSCP